MTKTSMKSSFSQEQALDLYREATAAGEAAMAAVTPTPMVWGDETVLFSGILDPDTAQVEVEGACGFASVYMPGNTSLARHWKAAGLVKKDDYRGGVFRWVREGVQSFERKCAFASAFAAVLTENGVTGVYVWSRMD